MSNIWDEDVPSLRESIGITDSFVEDTESEEPNTEPELIETTDLANYDEAIEEIQENSAFDLDLDESDKVLKARLRLEQAQLYEMLINHNIFEGVEATPEVIGIVQNELKDYIIDRLEILLGLKQPELSPSAVDCPFNDIEIDFLKQLSFKGTFGKSADQYEESLQPKKVKKANTLKPLPSVRPTIKPVNKVPQVRKVIAPKAPQPKPAKVAEAVPNKTIPQKKKSKVNTNTKNDVHSKIQSGTVRARNLTQQEIEQLALEDLKKMKKRKPFHKMSAKEKEQEIKEVNARHHRKKSINKLPMPTEEELRQKYLTEQQLRATGRDAYGQFNELLKNIIINKKSQE